MQFIKINKTFKSKEEQVAWENENLKDQEYQGKKIFMVMYDEDIATGNTVLNQIITV